MLQGLHTEAAAPARQGAYLYHPAEAIGEVRASVLEMLSYPLFQFIRYVFTPPGRLALVVIPISLAWGIGVLMIVRAVRMGSSFFSFGVDPRAGDEEPRVV